jgi:galactokinase
MRRFFAPGRVNLIGEHTDYSGGLVLPAAIELGITLDCEPLAGRIRLRSEASAEAVDLTLDGSESGDGWGRYVAAVAAELADLGREPAGLDGTLASDLPAGAGLSSSAALEVVVALALCAVADFSLPPLELARLAQRAELRAIGKPCGIMDQAASLLGVADHAILLDTDTLAHETVPLPAGIALVILDSGISHAEDEQRYAERRTELEQATRGRAVGSLSPAAAEELIAAEGVADVPARRLRHIAGENERVREVVAALRQAPPDLAAIGRLFRAGHDSLRDLFEVSLPELDLLVDLAYEQGAVAARMTGGGFGGSVLALVRVDEAARLAAGVLVDYRARTGLTGGRAYVTRAADGARELPV